MVIHFLRLLTCELTRPSSQVSWQFHCESPSSLDTVRWLRETDAAQKWSSGSEDCYGTPSIPNRQQQAASQKKKIPTNCHTGVLFRLSKPESGWLLRTMATHALRKFQLKDICTGLNEADKAVAASPLHSASSSHLLCPLCGRWTETLGHLQTNLPAAATLWCHRCHLKPLRTNRKEKEKERKILARQRNGIFCQILLFLIK